MFKEHLGKRRAEVQLERLNVTTVFEPLTPEELEECAAMGSKRGAKYALYLSSKDMAKEGYELFEKGEIGSPEDIADALSMPDIMVCYELIKEISGYGKAMVRANVLSDGGIMQGSAQPEAERLDTAAYSGEMPAYEAPRHETAEQTSGLYAKRSEKAGNPHRYDKKGGAALTAEEFARNLALAAGNM